MYRCWRVKYSLRACGCITRTMMYRIPAQKERLMDLLNQVRMKMLLSVTGILLLATCPDAGASTMPAMFTLHTQPTTWNDAHRACVRQDMTLVLPRTEQLHMALLSYIHMWQDTVLRMDGLWFGLHDSTYRGSPVFYWNDCTALDPPTWTNWGISEPNDVQSHKCMALSGSNFMWNSSDCTMPKQFVCQAALDSCWYDSILDAELVDPTVDVDADDEEVCAVACLNYTGDGECKAMTYHNDGRCRLLIGQTILVAWDPEVAYSESSVTKVKRCYWHNISEEEHIINRVLESFPTLFCTTADPVSLVIMDHKIVNSSSRSLPKPAPSSSCLVMTTTVTTELLTTSTCPSPSTVIDVSTLTVYSSSVVTEIRTRIEYLLTTRVEYSIQHRTLMATVVDVATVTEHVTATVTQTDVLTETLPATRIQQLTQTVNHVQTEILVSPMSCMQWLHTSSNDTNTTFEALRLDTRSLSSSRRKSSSAYDARPSAIFVGTLGIGIIMTLIVVVLILDFGTMVRQIKKLHRRRKRRKARMRASN